MPPSKDGVNRAWSAREEQQQVKPDKRYLNNSKSE